jgi:phenylpyruvate tautomerase PptA (4-oxalocrotonate tautomerase family)
MPHLQFETTATPSAATRRTFTDWVTAAYAERMETGTAHVAVTVRQLDHASLALGRASADEPVAVCNADVRQGRTADQREAFATAVIDRLADDFGVPPDHCYVVYSEHPGEDFLLAEGPLASWSAAESTTGAVDDRE